MAFDWNAVRLHALESKLENMLPEGVEILRVVGVSFAPGYPGRILALEGRENEKIFLSRNPQNQYDENAVEVRLAHDHTILGHLSRDVAARVAPKLDNGDSYFVNIHKVLINPEDRDHPGLDIQLEWLPK